MKLIYKAAFATILFGVGYTYIGIKKKLNIINKIRATLSGIRDVSISSKVISLIIDLKLLNPTNTNIDISTFGTLKIKQLHFYNRVNNNLLGVVSANISDFSIPAKNTLVLKNISVKIPVIGLLQNMSFLTGDIKKNLEIIIVIDALGKRFEIKTDI